MTFRSSRLAIALLTAGLAASGCRGAATSPGTTVASGLPPIAVGAPGVANPFGLPSTVTLALPPGLALVSQGAGNLVSQGGGNLVSQGGGNLVSQGGGNAIAPRFTLEDTALPSSFLGFLLPSFLDVYFVATGKIDAGLQALAKAGATQDQTVTYATNDALSGQQTLTVKLHIFTDHAIVQIVFGPTFEASKVAGTLSYTDPHHGKLLIRPNVPGIQNYLLATSFDQDKHVATADGLMTGINIAGDVAGSDPVGTDLGLVLAPGPRGLSPVTSQRFHFEFAQLSAVNDASAGFSLAATAFRRIKPFDATSADLSGRYGLAARFAADGTVGAIAGRALNATSNDVSWFSGDYAAPLDGKAPHDLYARVEQGKLKDVARAQATAAMKALVPADSALPGPFPADPDATDPMAAPFAMPQ